MSGSSTHDSGLMIDLPDMSRSEQVAALRAAGPVSTVIQDLVDQTARLLLTDLDRALRVARALVDLSDEHCGGEGQSRARRVLAQALAGANRHEEALEVGTEAIALAEASGADVDAGLARMAMIQVLDKLGQPAESIAMGEAARRIFNDADESVLAAKCEVNLGVAHRVRGNPASALQHFDRARPVFADNPMIVPQIDSNRAEALLELNEYVQAEEAFRSALRSFEETGATRAAAIVEGNLADLLYRQGRLHQALHHFERSRRALEQIASDVDGARLARLASEQAETFAAAGLLTEALECYREAVPVLEGHRLVWEAARARVGEAAVLHALGRTRDAHQALHDAEVAFPAGEDDPRFAQILLAQGRLALAQGDADAASTPFERAAALLHDRPVELAGARHDLARLALARNDLSAAARELARAMRVMRRAEVPPMLADMLHTCARLRDRQGRHRLAIRELRDAAACVERLRGAMQAERLRAGVQGERTAVYADLVRLLVSIDDPHAVHEALGVVEQARSRALFDLTSGAIDLDACLAGRVHDASLADLLAEAATLRAELNALYSGTTSVVSDSEAAPRPSDWRERIARTEGRLELLEGRLAARREFGSVYAPPLDAAGIQAMLDADTALIEYYTVDGHVVGFVVRSDSVHVVPRLASTVDVREVVDQVRFQMDRAVDWIAGAPAQADRLLADATRTLESLHELLLAPLREQIGDARRLVIVPHGVLHGVPLHAAQQGGQTLLDEFEITYAPSASLLRHLVAPRRPTGGDDAVVLGFADEVAPQIDEEARFIAGRLATDHLLRGEHATKAGLIRAAPQASLIHLACHARFLPANPMGSGLRLADGWMTVRDLYELELQAPLIVLSGCDTGRTTARRGDEIVGLTRGFLAAGAACVVTSLWTLNDESANCLVSDFYERWHTREASVTPTAASALRAAQLAMKKSHPHPVFWAPFALVGQP